MNVTDTQKAETASRWRRFLKSTSLTWLVPKVRDDGTPAIYLTFDNWLNIEEGIVRRFLDARASTGEVAARNELKKVLGPDWKRHPRLASYATLDQWPGNTGNARACLEMFKVGYEAWHHIADRGGYRRFTPDSLVEAGIRKEREAAEAEKQRLVEMAEARYVSAEELFTRLKNKQGHTIKNYRERIESFEVWPEDVAEIWMIQKRELQRLDDMVEEHQSKKEAA